MPPLSSAPPPFQPPAPPCDAARREKGALGDLSPALPARPRRVGSGELFKALSCFALRGIDLTKIERRAAADAAAASAAASCSAFHCRPGPFRLSLSRLAAHTSLPARPAPAACRSRPMRSQPISVVEGEHEGSKAMRFSYLFYADLNISTAELKAQNALRNLEAREKRKHSDVRSLRAA